MIVEAGWYDAKTILRLNMIGSLNDLHNKLHGRLKKNSGRFRNTLPLVVSFAVTLVLKMQIYLNVMDN